MTFDRRVSEYKTRIAHTSTVGAETANLDHDLVSLEHILNKFWNISSSSSSSLSPSFWDVPTVSLLLVLVFPGFQAYQARVVRTGQHVRTCQGLTSATAHQVYCKTISCNLMVVQYSNTISTPDHYQPTLKSIKGPSFIRGYFLFLYEVCICVFASTHHHVSSRV